MTEPTDERAPEEPRGARRLDLDDVDLVPEQTSDDTDAGWEPAAPRDPVAELRRYLDEKPPHHGD